jgi:hypothetical protein
MFVILIVSFYACKKDPKDDTAPTPAATAGTLNLHFEGMVGDSSLVFNTQSYTNANNDTFKVSTFKFYISNISVRRVDGHYYTESNSYHLIDFSNPASCDIALASVPFGNYDSISFMIGVDSIRNVSGAQTGALDPANGMFWSWSSGYIMAKFEGTSPQSTATGHSVTFHIGGFSGVDNTLKTVHPTFHGATANVSTTVSPEIHFSANLLEWFTTPTTIHFGTLNDVTMPGANSKTIADNYEDMLSVEHIHN